MNPASLYMFDLWALGLIFLALLLAMVEVGFRIGRKASSAAAAELVSQQLSIETAVLGVLGLLLGFTMSMSVSRFEMRRQLVVEEANSLGTSYLRTKLLAEPGHKEIAGLLCRYVLLRLDYVDAGDDRPRILAARRNALELQDEFWNKAAVYAQNDPHPVPASLLLQSLNQSIDMEAARWAALHNVVPKPVIITNGLVALLAGSLVGYMFGVTVQRRQVYSMLILSVVITVVLIVIVDLDRPRSGLIHVGQQPMLELKTQLLNSAGNCKL